MTNLSSFTQQEKEACLPVVETMIEATEVTRNEGVLALEEWIQTQDSDFLKILVLLVVDGTDPDYVMLIGKNLLASEGKTGEELLARMIMLEGVLSMQAGENPRIVKTKLLSMLGERFLINSDCVDACSAKPEERLAVISKQAGIAGSKPFDEIFELLSNRDVQQVLRETDFHDLVPAIKYCNGKAAMRIFDNCSPRLVCQILDTLPDIPESNSLAAQGVILELVKRLQNNGEIATPKGSV